MNSSTFKAPAFVDEILNCNPPHDGPQKASHRVRLPSAPINKKARARIYRRSQLSDRTVRGSSAVRQGLCRYRRKISLTVPRFRNLSPAVRLLLWEELRQRGEASPRPARLALATKAVTIFAPAGFVGLYDGRLAEDRNSPGANPLGMGATIYLSEKHNSCYRAFMSLQRSPIGLAARDRLFEPSKT